jgi:cyclophilin family peptidyl-prolyl cis-trans isomerase
MSKRLALAVSIFHFGLISAVWAAPTADGLYATFETNHGEFVAKLDYDKVPMTVANFVSLAEGTRAWVDASKGGLSNAPYYNGLTFHRVISGFMIQGGSPNGLGTDGPGYVFADEFHPTLSHGGAGVLSMANSGANSNGSQFFVTLAATTHLDDKHSVFGNIVEGMSVVNGIGGVATGVNAKPFTPVVIESVTITRNGAAAQAFNPLQYGLPVFGDAKPRFRREAGDDFIDFPAALPFSEDLFYGSGDLENWAFAGAVEQLAVPLNQPIDVSDVTSGEPRYFFQVARAKYADRPSDLVGKSLSMVLTSGGNQPLVLNFTGPERSTVNFSQPLGTSLLDNTQAGTIGAYITYESLHSKQLIVAVSGLSDFLTINLAFRTPTSGTFTGQFFSTFSPDYWPLYGGFMLSP